MRVQSVLSWGFPLLIAAILLPLFRDYRTDDTYIYLQFARNLAAGAGFSFVPDEPTFGVTSWLWTLLLAAGVRVGIDPLVAAKFWGVLCSFASIAAVHSLGRSLFRHPTTAVLAASAWALHAWNLRWSLSGLETPLMVLCLALGWLWTIRETRDQLRPWRSGVLWALAILVRPEAAGLLLLAGVRQLWLGVSGSRTRTSDLVFLILPGLLAVGSVGGWAWVAFGNPLPNSIAAKGTDGGWTVTLGILATELKILLATDAIFLGWVLLALVTSVGQRIRARSRGWSAGIGALVAGDWFIPTAWSVAVFLIYALMQSVIVSRYLVPESLVLLMGGFAVAERFSGRDTGRTSGSTVATAGVEVETPVRAAAAQKRWNLVLPTFLAAGLLNLGMLFFVILPHCREFPRELDRSIGSIATWLRENTPPETRVGAIDIGILAYESDRFSTCT